MSYSNRYTEPILVESKVGSDGFSNPIYDTPVERQVNVQRVEELVTDEHGDEVRSYSIIYFYDPTWITYDDRVTLSDGIERLVLKVRQSPSVAGRETLIKVWLK